MRLLSDEEVLNWAKHAPVLYEGLDECCGCGACASICSTGAIVMAVGERGFLYPLLDDQHCIRCKRCIKVCPLK